MADDKMNLNMDDLEKVNGGGGLGLIGTGREQGCRPNGLIEKTIGSVGGIGLGATGLIQEKNPTNIGGGLGLGATDRIQERKNGLVGGGGLGATDRIQSNMAP